MVAFSGEESDFSRNELMENPRAERTERQSLFVYPAHTRARR
jgi:hypothetical protein